MAFTEIISGSAAASATILPVQALGGIGWRIDYWCS